MNSQIINDCTGTDPCRRYSLVPVKPYWSTDILNTCTALLLEKSLIPKSLTLTLDNRQTAWFLIKET